MSPVSTHVPHDSAEPSLVPPFPSRSLPPGSSLPTEDGEPMETERHLAQMNA
jgi:hypothetical protein